MTKNELDTQKELHELEQRFGPGLGQYVYDQLNRTQAVNANNAPVEYDESRFYKKAA